MRSVATIVGIMIVSAFLFVGTSGCDCDEADHEGHEHGAAKPEAGHEGHKHEAAKPAPEGEIAQKTCPVMGGAIKKDIYTDHNGRRVYFCCGGCIDAFKKDPTKYLAKIDAEIQKAKDAAKPGD